LLGFEHPFVDGSGRTARALFYWSLLRQKYWLTEFLAISRVIQKAQTQYARAFLLTETDHGDLTYFLLHQLGVIREALDDLRKYLRRKTEQLREAEQLLRPASDLNYRQRTLIAHALRHPSASYTIEAYRRDNAVVYQTARADLLALADLGLLTQRKVGKAFVFDVPSDLERRLKRAGPAPGAV
jgi:Fic family protein